MTKPTNGAQGELRRLLEARYTLLWVVTEEERRVERAIASVALGAKFRPRFWDCAAGATDLIGKPVATMMLDDEGKPVANELPPAIPDHAFAAIRARAGKELWVLRDLHAQLREDPVVIRGLRNLARDLQDEPDLDRIACVVVVSPSREVPLELRAATTLIDWPLPDREEMAGILQGALNATSNPPRGGAEAVIEAAAGLTAEDAANAFALSLATHKLVDPALVVEQKRRIIQREGTLTWWPPDPRGLDAIGGLDNLKSWLIQQAGCLEPGARDYGLHAPRGVLLAGVPGCGKSATAKAIPAAWGDMPLLRLDMGSLKGSLVGQSEENIRRALKLADAMGRVVLWIDEVGKALAGSQGPAGDSGVAADALGELLFWMQEHQGESLVVATTNEVDLPPEFIRRFDATFFVDLPTNVERAAILAVALRNARREPDEFGVEAVAAKTAGFSGDEMAKLVQKALLAAWADGKREPTQADLLRAARETVPMSKSSGEKIKALRAWAQGRAMPASRPEKEAAETAEMLPGNLRFEKIGRRG